MPLTSTERSRNRRNLLKNKAEDGDATAVANLEKKAYGRELRKMMMMIVKN